MTLQMFQREEQFFECNPLLLIDRLADAAERQTILSLKHFSEALRRVDQSGQKTEVAEARAKARQQSVEKMATVLAESRAVNFDKLELFSLNFVFKITPHQQERIWRRSRRTTAAPSAAHQLDLDEARDRSDAALVAGTDESRLDAEIEALRQAVWKEQQRSTRLQAVNDRAQSVLASLRPVLGRAPQGQALVSLSALSDAFNSLGAQIDALAQLESVTRVALKNTMLDLTPAAAAATAAETPILSSSSSPSPPLSHQQKQESSIKAGSLETSESANENVVLPGSSSTHSLKISAPMQESPTDQRFAQLVQRFNGHAAVAASNDLARLLAMIRL